jgi:DNA-binding NtrC family response regulator
VVLETVLETDLARARDEDVIELVNAIVTQRRSTAVREGLHHVVGFVRNQPWPNEVEELASRFSPDRQLAPGATTALFVDLRGGRVTADGDTSVAKGLKFLFSPEPDQRFLDEVRDRALETLETQGYVEIDRLSRQVELPRGAVAWLLDRLPWEGERTVIDGVGEVYRRSLLEE